ncbi:MAG: AzlC family ABC transporter permease [Pseudomonadota bacterium]
MTAPSQADPPVTLTLAAVLRGMQRLFPVSLFVLPFGTAFGVAAVDQGLSAAQAIAMSALVFTAIAQFAALDLLIDPVPFGSLVMVMLALNARHVIIGAALARWINQLSWRARVLTLAFLSDANFADTRPMLQGGDADLGPLLGGGLMLWLAWVSSTALGALAGDLIGDTSAYGFGAVMVYFFAAQVVRGVRTSGSLLLCACVAMGVAVMTHANLPVGWNVILAALIGGGLAAATDAGTQAKTQAKTNAE